MHARLDVIKTHFQTILNFFPPRHAVFFLFCLSKEFSEFAEKQQSVTEAFWQSKMKQYFPNNKNSKAALPWFRQYTLLEENEYIGHPLIVKNWFEAAKGGEVDYEVKEAPLAYFDWRDTRDRTFIDWALEKGNQTLLDRAYAIVHRHYDEKRRVFLKTNDTKSWKVSWESEANELYWAIQCRQGADTVRCLVKAGRNPGEMCYSTTGARSNLIVPFNLAAKLGHLKAMHCFIEGRVSQDISYLVNLRIVSDEAGSVLLPSPLYNAVSNGHLSVVQFLLQHRANCDWKRASTLESGSDLLRAAAQGGHLDILKLLMTDLRSNLNLPRALSGLAFLALEAAITGGCSDIVHFLMKENIIILPDEKEVLSASREGPVCPLYRALLGRYFEVADVLAEYVRWPEGMQHNQVFIEELYDIVIRHGQLGLLKKFIDQYDWFLKAKHSLGYNLLILAVFYNRSEIVKYLLIEKKMACSKEYFSSWGKMDEIKRRRYTKEILKNAIENGLLAIVKVILEIYPDLLNQDLNEDGYKHFPLFIAIDREQVEIVRFLLEQKPNLQITDYAGDTPFARAVSKKNPTLRKIFDKVEVGICQATHVAAATGQLKLLKKIMQKNPLAHQRLDANQINVLFYAAASNQLAVIKYLHEECGASLNVTIPVESIEVGGQVLLHIAAHKGHDKTVAYLLEQKVSLEAVDKYKETPLCTAIRAGHDKITQMLIEQGADLKAAIHASAARGKLTWVQQAIEQAEQKGEGPQVALERPGLYQKTPLMAAAEEGQVAVVKYLLSKGASIYSKVIDGSLFSDDTPDFTALDYARLGGHHKVVALLLLKAGRLAEKASGISAVEGPIPTAVVVLSEKNKLKYDFVLLTLAKYTPLAKEMAKKIISTQSQVEEKKEAPLSEALPALVDQSGPEVTPVVSLSRESSNIQGDDKRDAVLQTVAFAAIPPQQSPSFLAKTRRAYQGLPLMGKIIVCLFVSGIVMGSICMLVGACAGLSLGATFIAVSMLFTQATTVPAVSIAVAGTTAAASASTHCYLMERLGADRSAAAQQNVQPHDVPLARAQRRSNLFHSSQAPSSLLSVTPTEDRQRRFSGDFT